MACGRLTMMGSTTNGTSQWLNRVELPAGSGKTTGIHQQIMGWHRLHPYDNILAITYTERAAAELSKDMEQEERIVTSTIHGFVANLLTPLFKCPEVVDSYFEWQEEAVNNYIEDNKHKDNIKRYTEKHGQEPTLKLIKAEAYKNGIRYSRTRYGSRLYSRISHDELLEFFVKLTEDYPLIGQKIGKGYNLIVIDEFQDTNYHVLRTFADIAKRFSTSLWIYGDRMQQIYKDHDIELNEVLSEFTGRSLEIVNHRSRPEIVHMLNKLANDSSFRQKCDPKYSVTGVENDGQSVLEAYLTQDPTSMLETLRQEHNKALALVVFNKERFNHYGLSDLFEAYSHCNEYRYSAEYSAADILLPNHYDEAIDDIDRYILTIIKAGLLKEADEYGEALRLLRQKNNSGLFASYTHDSDTPLTKERLVERIDDLGYLFELIQTDGSTVKSLLQEAYNKHFINEEWYRDINDENNGIFSHVKSVSCKQFLTQYDRIINHDMRHVSTQHGVKGESYDSVIFVAEDSIRHAPGLNIYGCLRLMCKNNDFNLDYLLNAQKRVFDIAKKHFGNDWPISKQDNFVKQYESNAASCSEFAKNTYSEFHGKSASDALFYQVCWEDTLDDFLEKATSGTVPKYILEKMGSIKSKVTMLISAFRIFYVGCSRARSELRIILDTQKMVGWESDARTKLGSLGFNIREQ